MNGRFVPVMKNEGLKNVIWKARFVVQKNRNKLETALVHNLATTRQNSVKMLIGIAAIFGFRIFSTDITQAYLQIAETLIETSTLNLRLNSR